MGKFKRKRSYGSRRAKPRSLKRRLFSKKKRAKRSYRNGQISGMPKIRRTSMRYADHYPDVTSTMGGITNLFFKANGIHDPDAQAGGHQPMGRDQWALLYNHYTVVGAIIRIRIMPNASNLGPCMAGVYLNPEGTSSMTMPSQYIEQKRGMYRQFHGGEKRPINLVCKFSARKFFSVKNPEDREDLGASLTTSADPTELAYFNFWFLTMDGGTASVNMTFQIDYRVKFREPKTLAQS